MGSFNLKELDLEAQQLWENYSTKELTNRERMAIPDQHMATQEVAVRVTNMEEVALGYSEAQVRVEALRCLHCKNAPCITGCPVQIDIPRFIALVGEGKFGEAVGVIKESSLLPAICGRVCPQEVQCQLPCTVGKSLKSVEKAVNIGRIERFVADWEMEKGETKVPSIAPPTGKKVAVVGSGPASMTAAADLRRAGHQVVMFEALHKTGGVLVYGIPEFRLPKEIVRREFETLIAMGVEIETNFLVGRTSKLKELIESEGFDAVFLGTGAGLPRFLK
ncbi:MAG: NAD(P)-binding protein, partial [Sphaerochaetaceae bacterium]